MEIGKRLLDRLVFAPTTHAIDPEGRIREVVSFKSTDGHGEFELWGHRLNGPNGSDVGQQWVILKFPGAGGRAERSGIHPAEALPENSVVSVWTVNPPGYGTSGGKPSLAAMSKVIRAAVVYARQENSSARMMVTGNSLGCVWALYAAAHLGIDGMLLRNPFSLRQLVASRWRYNWWNLGMARFLATTVPDELDSVANARRCLTPTMIVQSELDSVIPVKFQNSVIDALAGPKELIVIPNADHGDPLPETMWATCQERLQRLLADL